MKKHIQCHWFPDGHGTLRVYALLGGFELPLDPLTILISVIQEFFEYLHANVSSIPFAISFGAAIVLTAMYLASFISSTLIKTLLIPVWVFSVVTYFFPKLIPKEYEFASLAIFATMVFVGTVIMRLRRKPQAQAAMDRALSEIVEWMKASQLLNPNLQTDPEYVQHRIREILKRNKVA